ncbi:NAD(P)/FAD-dependent oxidoreductase [Pseudomonas sp. RIT-PI-S]|uniref:flavin monoamine oxidase family protein n=1 Tax=Pseudomonas sp. RIT-PI-S TaxID=3035295 RepID=UPI0021DA214E|nr:NAD(P)/FAD-dependent oxidoreductase [Pseudomonas sp. RIT-PI-S]
MTIGSSFDHPADLTSPGTRAAPWAARFPNPPDLCFDYRKLVELSGGIAEAKEPERRIGIIGAGVAGLCAARELLRAGFKNVTLIEQSSRIGGRHLTVAGPDGGAPFEMGAMRIPFFNRTGEPPQAGRSLMAYFAGLFDLKLSNFPNPGTSWVNATGIYLREGCLLGDTPQLLIWTNATGEEPPPSDTLQRVFTKWLRFAKRMSAVVSLHYGTARWPMLWAAIVERYSPLSFRDLVHLEEALQNHPDPSDFGGLGMTEEESRIFYAIGIGDGSWGAFYDVCCLYPLRTAIFGFSSHLQLVHGRVDANDAPLPAPFIGARQIKDSAGHDFDAPAYLGIAALDDCLMHLPIAELHRSMYETLVAKPDGLLMRSKVTRIERRSAGELSVTVKNDEGVKRLLFDELIVTIPSWILETCVELIGFDKKTLPFEIIDAWKHAHWESSCKVYAPLDKAFFEKEIAIPQILVTDSFVHDVYAYRYSERYKADCILLSYTWEDDANKLCAFTDSELAQRCLAELDRILLRCTNVGLAISPYVDISKARVQRWLNDPNAHGCARLYRPGTYQDVVRLMAFNRDHSGKSRLYLAGEGYSADAGWTEPALRGALDAVINLCNNTGARFHGGFSMGDYPEYYQRK